MDGVFLDLIGASRVLLRNCGFKILADAILLN